MPLLAFAATALAFTPTANATPVRVPVAFADLNGDGRLDTVAANSIADNPNEQLLVATVKGIRFTARAPLDSVDGVQPLRVVDLDGDGRDEVVVTESVGANTYRFSAWGLFGNLRPIMTADHTPFMFWEGGGISAISRYGCEPAGDHRQLVTVDALLQDWDNLIYEGQRTTYSLDNGIATQTSQTPVTGTHDDPALRADPHTCA